MIFSCTIKELIDKRWHAKSTSSAVGTVEVTATSRTEALEKLKAELHYRAEWCPCSSVAEDYVELQITEESKSPWRGSVF